jgi:outer membrane protein insertion porin family
MTPSKTLRLLSASLLLASGTALVTPVAAQEAAAVNAPQARRIVKQVVVQFKGGASLGEARVRAQMSTREGEVYTDENVEQDIRSLYASGSVDNVEISASDVAGGVKVTVVITGRGAVGEVVIRGNSIADSDRLIRESEIKVGDPVDEARLSKGQAAIRELYEKRGYPDVSVTYQTEPAAENGFTRVVYVIGEGARGLVRQINFEGNSSIPAKKLRAKMTMKEKALWRVWRGKAGKMNDEAITTDVKAVEGVYQDAGYVYAKVLEVRRIPVDSDYMDLVFVVNEGERYDVGTVRIEGATVFTPEDLTKALKTVAGFAYAGSDVSDDEKMIGDYYGSRGYADARVETSIIPAGTGRVDVLYRIAEGGKSLIRKLNIQGNEVTQDQVIRREMPIAPGDELNTVKMEAGKKRLDTLGYFSNVDIRANPTDQEGFKDVDVNVTEQSTGSVNFGAGFSSIDSLVGFIDLTQTNFDLGGWPNFRGAGQRFHMGLRYGTQRRDFSLALTEPWFLGQKLSFTTELFYRDLFYLSDYFDQQNFGGSLSWRKPMGEHSYLELSYTAQNIKIHNIAANASDLIRREEGKFFQSKIDLSWVHDTRDSVYLTRTGHKVELGGMYSGLGGDVDVYGLNATASQFFLLPWDTIFSIEGSIRTVDANSGTVPIFERLFLGGANNLRGFQFREVGPKDEQGEPIGGQTSAYASFEYTFPIVEKVRGAVFYDVGVVSGDSYDWGGDVNSNVGVGLRLFLPIGPIRVDFGVPVQSDRFNDSGGQFQFNVGYKF